ncbi:LicD family protein [Virgibacillus sp. 179-BFC.A HS]|uniref:LicD family protein n=1 Tax=Tigheibacillus jepli TaxID=3035914 RepID=A0ABU5CES7_9BACI|nr:LicD family protein [Virgibacillus sp. 179-BFC.A HS]MDY0404841.1 LicD family protein [Virgibacillus sp. 179-BFC.A HS]
MYHLLTDLFYKLGVYRYAKKFLRRPYLNMLSFLFRLSAKSAIKKFASIMDKNHYLYWLEFGTLLGAVREQRLISHDADIDVAMHVQDRDINLEKVLRQHGFRLIRRARLLTGELIEETYTFKTARIDIFYAYRKGNKIVMYDYETMDGLSPNECIRRYGGLRVYENVMTNFELTHNLLYGRKVHIPDNYDHHLTELYGTDFMKPDKNWELAKREIRSETSYLAMVE